MKSSKTKLDKLKHRAKQLKVSIQKMENFDKKRGRKQELQRKILVGEYYLNQAMEQENTEELYQKMLGYLKRESDKVLFVETEA